MKNKFEILSVLIYGVDTLMICESKNYSLLLRVTLQYIVTQK